MSKREHWASSLGFVLAAAGSAVGLGNIWKFPYEVGANGGGAFILIFLVCAILLGFPLMLCELLIGRATQKSPIGAFRALNIKKGNVAYIIGGLSIGLSLFLFMTGAYGFGLLSFIIGCLIVRYRWIIFGWTCVLTGFFILSFYGVVGGWILYYCYYSIDDLFTPYNASLFATPETTEQLFKLVSSECLEFGSEHFIFPWRACVGYLLFMSTTFLAVYVGIKNGIEKWSRFLMPIIFVVIFILIGRGLTLDGAFSGIVQFMTPNFSEVTSGTVLIALGHAFFSLSLGMGCMITYGSYTKNSENLFKNALYIVGLDTLVSILACLAIFPFVFAMGLTQNAGPGLIFNTLPQAFHQMGITGSLWAFLFFVFIFFAAVTSSISIFEVLASSAMEELKWTRKKAAVYCGCLVTLLGFMSVLSCSNWENLTVVYKTLSALFDIKTISLFDFLSVLTSHYLMPIGGLMTALFVGWTWGAQQTNRQLLETHQMTPLLHVSIRVWTFLVRYVLPAGCLVILLSESGLFKFVLELIIKK